jgi:hypothetical protein
MNGFLLSRKVNTKFKNHDRVLFFNTNFMYILPIGYEIPSHIDYINKNNSLYYSDDSSLYEILIRFQHIIVSETMNLTWYLNSEKYKKLKQIQIWFITHGLTTLYDNDRLLVTFKGWKKAFLKNKKIKVLVCCNILYDILNQLCPNNKNQIIKINSLPQFYNNLNILKSVNHNDFEKTICIVSSILSDIEIDHIHLIVNTINNLYKNTNIVIKIKSKYSLKAFDDLINVLKNKCKNITIDFFSPIVNFVSCKKIIVLSGGTSFFEILQYNNNTFIYPLYNIYYTEIPLDFKKLLIPSDVTEFEKYLKLSDNEKYFNDEYMIEKKNLFKFQMGTDKIVEDISEINDIINCISTSNKIK